MSSCDLRPPCRSGPKSQSRCQSARRKPPAKRGRSRSSSSPRHQARVPRRGLQRLHHRQRLLPAGRQSHHQLRPLKPQPLQKHLMPRRSHLRSLRLKPGLAQQLPRQPGRRRGALRSLLAVRVLFIRLSWDLLKVWGVNWPMPCPVPLKAGRKVPLRVRGRQAFNPAHHPRPCPRALQDRLFRGLPFREPLVRALSCRGRQKGARRQELKGLSREGSRKSLNPPRSRVQPPAEHSLLVKTRGLLPPRLPEGRQDQVDRLQPRPQVRRVPGNLRLKHSLKGPSNHQPRALSNLPRQPLPRRRPPLPSLAGHCLRRPMLRLELRRLL